MTKLGIGSLVVGLVAVVLLAPYLYDAMQELKRTTAQLKVLNDDRDREAVVVLPTPAVSETLANPEPEVSKPAPAQESGTIESKAEVPSPALSFYVPGCFTFGPLRQAVNGTPGGSPYRGQLLVSQQYPGDRGVLEESKVIPCVVPGVYKHLTLGTVIVFP